jgi:hypothetical protein
MSRQRQNYLNEGTAGGTSHDGACQLLLACRRIASPINFIDCVRREDYRFASWCVQACYGKNRTQEHLLEAGQAVILRQRWFNR